jgi:riboflavin synthase
MFTGIVQATGRIVSRHPGGDGARIRVDAGSWDLADIAIGDSIAVGGCCLTVVAIGARWLDFDVSEETLRCTTGFDVDRRVNLEKSLRLADRLGGHLMSGHVDGVGTVTAFAPVGPGSQGSWHLEIDAPPALARYVAPKGSIAVDGVSLTSNAIDGSRFTVNLIPHTLAVTTLGHLANGARVNLEVDLIARYVERMHAAPAPAERDPGNAARG